ncbi:DUF6607 family protein [Sphingosinithalassobacter sp. CS137]|uniref:DUF6607 family protein n=1 Tax=Sphingosinithalassobacter sp. CS137 TaxID=2762748 RepID=UPI001CB6F3C2|nr:DUF6607 family protein [Sphingosinithalassobacter sp. CS137]
MNLRNWTSAAALVALTALPNFGAAAQAAPAAAPTTQEEAQQVSFDEARAAILAMAGNYRVRFDMREATPWRADYEPIDPKISGGHEVVRVIEDSGERIVLQHLLVIEHEGQTHIIKHWRQDWEYEPARMLVYSDTDTWQYRDVSEAERRGRWAQTVWQVDDSPRYAGIAAWKTVAGIPTWQSNPTWRPLARRDAVRSPVYDRYYGINRHQLTPAGWIHWQDNMKMGWFDAKLEPVVQEYVLNTYSRFDGYDVAAADAYWESTKGMWAAVRDEWERIAEEKNGIRVMEVAETGSAASVRLLEIADALHSGSLSEAEAIAQAKALMDQATQQI